MDKPPRKIELRFSGAQIQTEPLNYQEELWAATAGPICSLLLGLVFPLAPTLAIGSVILGLFNLLPIPQLDGWRILRCVLLLQLRQETAIRIMKYISGLTALALWGSAVYLSGPGKLGLWPILIAALFLYKAMFMEVRTSF